MKGGQGHDPADPGLQLVPNQYRPSAGDTSEEVGPAFVEGVILNKTKGLSLTAAELQEIVDNIVGAWSEEAEANREFLRNRPKVVAFVNTAVRNDFKDLLKKRKVRLEAEPHLIAQAENRLTVADPLTLLIADENRQEINRAFERLPRMQRLVCTLSMLEEWERAEICAAHDIEPKTYDVHRDRGIKKLAVILRDLAPGKLRKEQA